EKLGFLFYATYYLQAAFFIVGSAAWLVAEVGFHAHVPEWTATLGWSLLLTNLLSMPLMNFAGLLIEGAPAKDFIVVLGAVASSLDLSLGVLVVVAVHAPITQAAGTSLFLHGAGPFTLDATSPGAVLPQTMLLTTGNSRTWAATSTTAAAQTISSTTSFSFNYWTLAGGGSANVTLTFAFSYSNTTSPPTTILQTT